MTINEIKSRLENRRNAIDMEHAIEYDYGRDAAYADCLELLNTLKPYEGANLIKSNDYIAMARAISDVCAGRTSCKGCPLDEIHGWCKDHTIRSISFDFEEVF